jgi:hypothetical protein
MAPRTASAFASTHARVLSTLGHHPISLGELDTSSSSNYVNIVQHRHSWPNVWSNVPLGLVLQPVRPEVVDGTHPVDDQRGGPQVHPERFGLQLLQDPLKADNLRPGQAAKLGHE